MDTDEKWTGALIKKLCNQGTLSKIGALKQDEKRKKKIAVLKKQLFITQDFFNLRNAASSVLSAVQGYGQGRTAPSPSWNITDQSAELSSTPSHTFFSVLNLNSVDEEDEFLYGDSSSVHEEQTSVQRDTIIRNTDRLDTRWSDEEDLFDEARGATLKEILIKDTPPVAEIYEQRYVSQKLEPHHSVSSPVVEKNETPEYKSSERDHTKYESSYSSRRSPSFDFEKRPSRYTESRTQYSSSPKRYSCSPHYRHRRPHEKYTSYNKYKERSRRSRSRSPTYYSSKSKSSDKKKISSYSKKKGKSGYSSGDSFCSLSFGSSSDQVSKIRLEHMEERADYAPDLIMTSDEECTIEATVNVGTCAISPRKLVDENENRTAKHGKKGHESDASALGASLSNTEIEEKGAKKKKKMKIKKEHKRSGSSSSSSSHRHPSPASSRKHTSPSRRKHGSPSSHRHRSSSPGGHRHHSPSSHRQQRFFLTRKHHSPSSSKRHYSHPSRDKIVTYSPSPYPERYRDVKVKQEYIKQEYFDAKIKEKLLEPPEHLHGSNHCFTCNITMNSLRAYQTHLNGKKHRKIMKVKNVPEAVAASIPATVVSEDQSKYPKAQPDVIRRKVQEPANIQAYLETKIKQPCPGLNFVTEIRGITRVQYYCSLCDSVCSSNSLEQHLTGFKHQLKSVIKLKPGAYEPIQNEPKHKIREEMLIILSAVQSQEGMGRMAVEVDELVVPMYKPYDPTQPSRDYRNIPSTSRGISREQSGMSFARRYEISTVPDQSASDYFCAICQAHMSSPQMWDAHIRGKRHIINVKKMPGEPKIAPLMAKTLKSLKAFRR